MCEYLNGVKCECEYVDGDVCTNPSDCAFFTEYDREEALYDYIHLRENVAKYEYIAYNDFKFLDGYDNEIKPLYWYNLAKDDGYDQWLITLCERWDIELDYHKLEQDNIREEIYWMEETLLEKLNRIVFQGNPFKKVGSDANGSD